MKTVKYFEKDGEEWETITISMPADQADQVRKASFNLYTEPVNIIRLAIRQFIEPSDRTRTTRTTRK